MSPQRIQLSRKKGYRKPEGAVVVARPSKWGNPFRVYRCDCCGYWDVIDDNGVTYLIDHAVARLWPHNVNPKVEAIQTAVRLFSDDLTYWFGGRIKNEPGLLEMIKGLRGRDLACWCPLEDGRGVRVPCHADVLLDLANPGWAAS